MAARFVLKKDTAGKFQFNLVAADGESRFAAFVAPVSGLGARADRGCGREM